MDSSRRKFLVMAALAPVAAMPASRLPAQDAVCYDPSTLPLTQRNQRRALSFAEQSTEAGKDCGHCAFYKPGDGTCGTCALLNGGQVTSAGVCIAFAMKQD
ncbi:MAG: high-potential iron-sulfur protein [Novosphingobium sp.]